MSEGIHQHRTSKIPQKNNSRRGEVYSSFLLLKFLGSQSQIGGQQALAYCRLLTDRSTAEQRSVECQTFVSYAEKSPLIFFPLLCSKDLWKGVSQPPVHIQHSRGARRAQGVMYWRNVVPQSSHSIKRECEECAFAHTGYYCTCV